MRLGLRPTRGPRGRKSCPRVTPGAGGASLHGPGCLLLVILAILGLPPNPLWEIPKAGKSAPCGIRPEGRGAADRGAALTHAHLDDGPVLQFHRPHGLANDLRCTPSLHPERKTPAHCPMSPQRRHLPPLRETQKTFLSISHSLPKCGATKSHVQTRALLSPSPSASVGSGNTQP